MYHVHNQVRMRMRYNYGYTGDTRYARRRLFCQLRYR